MSASSNTAPGNNPAIGAIAAQRQVRRAWTLLTTAVLAFTVACSGIGGAGYWYRGHATEKRTVCAEVVQGDRAFVRPAYQKNWSALPGRSGTGCATGTPILLNELDALQTRSGTQVLLTFWDNSTVQVFENTEVQMTELRTTRYIGRASAISLKEVRGLLLVTLEPGDYRRSRFQVNAGDATVLIKEGDGSAGGSFLVQATSSDTQDEDAPVTVRASIRRGIGAVRVAGYSGELRLGANEQTIVPPGGPAGDPTPARHDFVANSRFEPVGASGCDIKGPFTPWQGSCTPGLVDGKFGTLTTVMDTIDDQPVSALEISRSTASTDPANTGLRQVLDAAVADQPSLSLTADIKVLEQNVPGGGQLGSEFPIIVRINYYDGLSGTPITRTWGFYILPAANGVVPTNPSLVEARQVPANQWVPLRFDLRGLVPQPVRLESIEVYASGQGYRARITNVAIIGSE